MNFAILQIKPIKKPAFKTTTYHSYLDQKIKARNFQNHYRPFILRYEMEARIFLCIWVL